MGQRAYEADEVESRSPAPDVMIWLTRWGLGSRVDCPLTHFDVLDVEGNTVGVVKSAWPEQASREHEFISVRLNWDTSTVYIVPATNMRIDIDNTTVQLAYTEEQIRRSPRFDLQPRHPICA